MATRATKPKRAKAKPQAVAAKKAPPPLRVTRKGRSRITGGYEAAEATTENDDHWPLADALNANAANNQSVRKTLRERARSERDNNGYCAGLVDRLANDLVGTCPRLQLTIPGADRNASRVIEKAFAKWARQVQLGAKLRLLDTAATVDGEGFGLLTTNPRLDPLGVQLDLRLYETDQIDTPLWYYNDPLSFAGGKLDEFGNVVTWHFLKVHPGSDVWTSNYLDYDEIDSRRVVHWFKPRRAGQIRGVPEILSSLSLYAYLRRYTLATVVAAEFAASHAGVLETDATAGEEETPTIETMDEVEVARGKLLTLPGGWKVHPFDAVQPTNTYASFKGEILTEAGQPVGAPRNVSTGSSAEYNYSSGRLDIAALYRRRVDVRRQDLADCVLDKIAYAWLDEAALVPGLIPPGLPPVSTWSMTWRFDGFASIDPQKDAAADDQCLRNGSKTLAKIVGDDGGDWEEHLEQLAAEEKRRAELGLPSLLGAPAPSPGAAPPAPPVAASRIKAYDPSQPRNDQGEWSDGGGGGGTPDPKGKGGGKPSGSPPQQDGGSADQGHGVGRDATGAKTDAKTGQRYRVVDATTTHEGVKLDRAKNLSPAEAKDAVRWHDGMTQVGTNGPNGRLPDASRPQLNDAERGALQKYSYKNDRVLNAAHRGNKDAIANSPYGEGFYKEMDGQMQSAFSKAPVLAKPITVVRGMNLSPEALQGFVAKMEGAKGAGGTVSFDGYTSTAAPGGLAYKLGLADATASIPPAFRGNVAMKINAVHGLDMAPHSQLPGENEFLLNNRSKFKVRSVTEKNGRYTVELDQLPPEKPAQGRYAGASLRAADESAGLTDDEKALLKKYESDPDAAAKWLDTDADFVKVA